MNIRKLAKGQNCTLRFPGCQNDTDTTVLAHIRRWWARGGAGTAYKGTDDLAAVFSCHHCHEILDRRAEVPHQTWDGKTEYRWLTPEMEAQHCAGGLVDTHRVIFREMSK